MKTKITDNLTEGKVANKLVALALPLILGNMLQQLYHAADAAVIGRYLGHTAFAAAGVAGNIMNLFLFLIAGSCNGISMIYAELYGEKDWGLLRKESFLSLFFGCLCAAGFGILGALATVPLLQAMHAPAQMCIFVQDYLRVIYAGMPVAFLYQWCFAVLRAAGDTKTPLLALMAAVLLNVSLDFIFVLGCKTGIFGTAAATVVSQLFAAIACFAYMKRRFPCLLFGRKDIAWDCGLLLKTAKFGAVCALHQSSLYIGKLFVQGAVNTAGVEMIAAYTAASRIEGFINSFGDSGATAISVFVAQNRGAGQNGRAKQGFLKGLKIMVLLSICLSILLASAASGGLLLLMGEASGYILGQAGDYLSVILACYVLCFIGNSFVGWYRGMGMVQIPVAGTVLHILIRVVLSYLLIGVFGLSAVAIATGIGWAAVVIFQVAVYRAVGCFKKS